ncbi:MAG: hypothetical protein JRD88_08815 [Deltaproteobacteria bacterium]|jgi:predicted Zn-dependent protease|nr:hypothetical protein [Deltaproteobacteria bacterium]
MKMYPCLFTIIKCFAVGLLLNGCTTLATDSQVPADELSQKEEVMLGDAVMPRMLQMLGGRYHDEVIQRAVQRIGVVLGGRGPRPSLSYHFVVADRSEAALFTLPGGNIILTRGLLWRLDDELALSSILDEAVRRCSARPFGGKASRKMLNVSAEILAVRPEKTLVRPDSPEIRLAKLILERDRKRPAADFREPVSGANEILFSGEERAAFEQIKQLEAAYLLLDKARALEADGQTKSALSAYFEAATAAPEEPQILAALGTAYLRNGELTSAMIHLRKAESLQKDNYRILMGLGYGALLRNDLKSADSYLRQSVSLLPEQENVYLIAEVLLKQGFVEQSLKNYLLVVEADPDSKMGRAAKSRIAALENNR